MGGAIMFVAREKELTSLNSFYADKGFHFVVMYGRRRVGKTTLISEFIKDKPHIFFVAQEYDDRMALQVISERIYDYFDLHHLPYFENWNDVFAFIAGRAGSERLILVLDEFPYLAGANKSIPSILQNAIDHDLKNSNLFLIICGSSLSFMERGVLSEKSPLYGRLTAQMEINPFDYYDSAKFFPSYDNIDKVTAYGIMDGIPQYLIRVDDNLPLRKNVISAILSKASPLYEEPRNLLKEELRTPTLYNSIIEAVAKGSTKLNDIVQTTKMPSDKCMKYIRSLINLHIMERETPLGVATGKRSIYKLTDHFFKFWYAFVFENAELVEQGNGDLLYDYIIVNALSEYIGQNVFEDVCKSYMRRINGAKSGNSILPFLFTRLGRWWGTSGKTRSEMEIDIIAINNRKVLLGECKWTNSPVDIDILASLREKALNFTKYQDKYYILFSKTGFTEELQAMNKNTNDVILVSLEEMYL
jgi:AAA+ ATPase superfamily predicted ATPase